MASVGQRGALEKCTFGKSFAWYDIPWSLHTCIDIMSDLQTTTQIGMLTNNCKRGSSHFVPLCIFHLTHGNVIQGVPEKMVHSDF